MRLPFTEGRKRVYVDAKILNVHDPSLEREAFVGYLVEGTGEKRARPSEAKESDDAEVDAILFALEDLKGDRQKTTIICDHESVVSEALLENPGRQTESIRKLRAALEANRWAKLEVLKANPAHGVVTEYVNAYLKRKASGA